MQLIQKFIAVGYIDDTLGKYHHVNGVCERKDSENKVYGSSDHYPTIANIMITCDKATGEVVAVELVKD